MASKALLSSGAFGDSSDRESKADFPGSGGVFVLVDATSGAAVLINSEFETRNVMLSD